MQSTSVVASPGNTSSVGHLRVAVSGVARILVWGGGANVSTALYDLVI